MDDLLKKALEKYPTSDASTLQSLIDLDPDFVRELQTEQEVPSLGMNAQSTPAPSAFESAKSWASNLIPEQTEAQKQAQMDRQLKLANPSMYESEMRKRATEAPTTSTQGTDLLSSLVPEAQFEVPERPVMNLASNMTDTTPMPSRTAQPLPSETSFDGVVELASSPTATSPETSPDIDLRAYLTEKYGLGARAKLQDDVRESKNPYAAALAGLGAGLRGRDVSTTFKNAMGLSQEDSKQALADFDRGKTETLKDYTFGRQLTQDERFDDKFGRENDINSDESKLATKLARDMGYDGKALTAAQFKEQGPYFSKIYEMNMKRLESKAKAGPTEGQKVIDRKFGAQYDTWTSGGKQAAETEIKKLKGVLSRLSSGKVSTGGMTGAFPDRVTSNAVLSARSDVQGSIMNSLRPILGAQFTEKEGERVIRNTWNEADSTENNRKRINRLISDLEARAKSIDEKTRYFEKHGTLVGYSGLDVTRDSITSNEELSRADEEARAWAEANPDDPRAARILELFN